MKTLLLCVLAAGCWGEVPLEVIEGPKVHAPKVVQTINFYNPKVPDGCRQEGAALICEDPLKKRIAAIEKRVAALEKSLAGITIRSESSYVVTPLANPHPFGTEPEDSK